MWKGVDERGVDAAELQVSLLGGEGEIVEEAAVAVHKGVLGDDAEIAFEGGDLVEEGELVFAGEKQHFGIFEGIDVQVALFFRNVAVHVGYPPVGGGELEDVLEPIVIDRIRSQTAAEYERGGAGDLTFMQEELLPFDGFCGKICRDLLLVSLCE